MFDAATEVQRVTGRDCLRAMRLLIPSRLSLAPLINERFPLRRTPESFEAAQSRTALKIVLES